MKDLLLVLLHLAVTTAKLCGPSGVRAVIAENLLLKQQLIVLRRARLRAPNATSVMRVASSARRGLTCRSRYNAKCFRRNRFSAARCACEHAAREVSRTT